MRLAVNGKAFARTQKGGAARMGVNLVRWIAALRPRAEIEVFVPCHSELSDLPGDLPPAVRFRRSESRLYGNGPGRSAWEQFVLPTHVRRGSYGALLNPTNSLPVLISPGTPQAVVVHDAGFLNREWFSRAYSAYLTWTLRRAGRIGVRVVTVSESAAGQLRSGIPGIGPVTVIPNDSDDPPAELAPEERGHPYVLSLGSLNPRKNLDGAIAGFRRFAERDGAGTRLVVVGASKAIFQKLAPVDDPKIEFLGYVDDERRWALLAGARLLLFPSFLEGFGLPVLEAMKVGTPVVASDIPVFRELFDGGVEFVDPSSPLDIARGIERVAAHKQRRAELVQRGRRIAGRFSPERTARAYVDLLTEMAAGG